MATLSQNISQAISDFASIKTAIEDKGVTVESGTPTSEYGDLISDISGGGDSTFIDFLNDTLTSVTIPDGTTKIRPYAFYNYLSLIGVTIPDGVTILESHAFDQCRALTNVTIPNSVTGIREYCFANTNLLTTLTLPNNLSAIPQYCFMSSGITSISIPHGVYTIQSAAFYNCSSLKTLSLPGTINSIDSGAFGNCSALEFVTMGNGFNGNRCNLSASTLYSAATIVGWLNALSNRIATSTYTLTIGATNLAKLTAEQIAIATNKNWNLN